MRIPSLLLALLATCTTVFAASSPDDLSKMMERIAADTKVTARMDFSGAVSEFKSDGDADTLELVFLNHADPKANTVSDDGEAIFLYQASDDVQSQLISRAFEIRAHRRLAGK